MLRRKLSICVLTTLMWMTVAIASPSAEPPDAEQCGAEYNYKRWSCRIDGGKFIQQFSGSITILNKKGDAYNTLSFAESGFTSYKELKARVKDADGKVVFERNKKEFSKACGYDNISLYSDHCHFYTTLSAAQYPYTIEWEYTRESQSLFFWPDAHLQHEIPVKQALYTLEVSEDFSFRYRVYDTELEPSITGPEDGRVIYVWEATDIPALEDVDYVPPGENLPARILFAANEFSLGPYGAESHTWQDIGKWYQRMAEDRYCPQKLITGVPAALQQPHRILESVFEQVRDHVRYVAIQIGVGGWQPFRAEKTHSRGFGDCKDMSTLLVSELRNRGVHSYPVLILTRSEGITDPDFPSPDFNHVITVALVGSDTIWMDPTCDVCRYDELPVGIQNIPALVMTPRGGQLWTTPASSPEENRTVRQTQWFVDEDLKVRFSTVLSVSGSYARYLRGAIRRLDTDEIRQLVNRQFRGAEKKYKIESYEIVNLDSLDRPVELRIDGAMTKPLRTIGSIAYFDPFIMNALSRREKTSLSNRQFSLSLYYPDLEEDFITITWDSALVVDSVAVPHSDSLTFPCGQFSLSNSQSDREISLTIRKAYDTYLIGTGDFEAFEDYRDRMKKSLSQHVKLYLQ